MPANVRTPKGKLVHYARATWEQTRFVGQEGPVRLSATVACNRVPAWHRFKVVDEPVTCPGCLARTR